MAGNRLIEEAAEAAPPYASLREMMAYAIRDGLLALCLLGRERQVKPSVTVRRFFV